MRCNGWLSKRIRFSDCSNEWLLPWSLYTMFIVFMQSLQIDSIRHRWYMIMDSSLSDWQMEYGLVCCKGRPDRISHLQRPRICLRRETDTESMSSNIQSVCKQYQSVSHGKDNNVINTKGIYHRPNIMSQCPSEIPLLHTSPRLFKASRRN